MKRHLRRLANVCLAALDRPLTARLARLQEDVQKNSFLLADLKIDRLRSNPAAELRDAEFRVFSQWGQDGIIQYLIQRVPIPVKAFVEFGVQDYKESNTRFLLTHDNWSGLVIDGSAAHVAAIQADDVYWRHDLTALCEFVTKDNINALIGKRFAGDIGVLCVDIDGNDYWVWEAIDVVQPRIVICEYNSVFGAEAAVTVPYSPDFVRTRAHYSNLYFGASLPALCGLARRKGYVFVGCNSAGNDAFFVRNDIAQNVKALTAGEGYVASKSRESTAEDGRLTFISGEERLRILHGLPVFDLERNELVKLPVKHRSG